MKHYFKIIISSALMAIVAIFSYITFSHFKFENETKVLNNVPSGNSYYVGNTANNNNGVHNVVDAPELQKELDDIKKRIDAIEQKAFEKESK